VKIQFYDRLSTLAKALCWAGVWAVIYLLLVIFLPTNSPTISEYNLSDGEYRIFTIFTGLPIVMVWFMAFFGYASLSEYAEKVDGTKEGNAFGAIAIGLKWLAWALPIIVCANILLGGIAKIHQSFLSGGLIISHYIYLVIALIAFTSMSNGSRGLREIVNKIPSKVAIRVMVIFLILISVAFCTVTLDIVDNVRPNPYRLPLWLILLTIIIPYLYAWLMGFFAVFEITEYRRTVRGLFYRNALRLIAYGATCVIIASVVLQYMTSSSPYLRRIQLGWPMLMMYATLMVFVVGFILVAVGASRLKKLEEV
jgi:hypothetical protein